MIQDIAPHIYDNTYRNLRPSAKDYALFFEDGRILCRLRRQRLTLPKISELQIDGAAADNFIYLFSIDGCPFFLIDRLEKKPENYSMEEIVHLRDSRPAQTVFAALTAGQLCRWYRSRRYCGKCGGGMEHHGQERALLCKACGIQEYPKISPAVIIGVIDGDRLLMSRYANRPFRHYALLAGFTEIGESIEETVKREVMEEVGLKVKNIRYYKSQPWAYSESLLFGFFADLDGPGEITLDEQELEEARWFPRTEIPEDSSGFSLTGEMIEAFRTGKIR